MADVPEDEADDSEVVTPAVAGVVHVGSLAEVDVEWLRRLVSPVGRAAGPLVA